MNKKEKIITFILCAFVLFAYIAIKSYDHIDKDLNKLYNVYLDGKYLGTIDSKDNLYSLIDQKQQVIKDKYDVSTVYPPNGLEIVENYSYSKKVTDINTIYNKIEELQDFTIHGYEINVSKTKDNDDYNIYVLDKEVFNSAVKEFILAFISEDDYKNYMNNTQEKLEDEGIIYNNLDILEDITIKETYISINEKIYQSSNELTQNLLFGFNAKTRNYKVRRGDTIASVADSFELNPKEILIANTKYLSEDSLLTVGDTITIAYVLPELSFSYEVQERKREEYDFNTTINRDSTKEPSYSEVTTAGVKGISLVATKYTVVNGEIASTVEIDEANSVVIREKVDQVITKGRVDTAWGWEVFQDTGSGWSWPTVNRYVVTSEFGYRSLGGGKKHNGIDISGTGWGSNIFAANEGTVVYVFNGCPNNGSYPNKCGGGYGNWVVIDHGNNLYTVYAHMLRDIPVTVGQFVKRGDVVGHMGNSGQSTGTHLHFGVSYGYPTSGAAFFNPRDLYK